MVDHNNAVGSVGRNYFTAKMIDRYSGARLILWPLARPATSQHEACKECGKKDSFDHISVYNCETIQHFAEHADGGGAAIPVNV